MATANFEGVYRHNKGRRQAGQCIACWEQGRAEKDEVFKTEQDYEEHCDTVHALVGFRPKAPAARAPAANKPPVK